MKVQGNPRNAVRDVVIAEYSPVEDSFEIVREKHVGGDATFAVTFEDRKGAQRQGVFGLRVHRGGAWQRSGGFMGSAHLTGDRDVWQTWGGWGGGSGERAVFGGWVAIPTAVSARATDAMQGRILEDVVEDGVVLFMYKGEFGLDNARLELLDAEGRILRTGPMHRRP
ncbi:hypothetical protein [Nocardioides sp. B-3]|uniref:hypothetical protein n=1 Tax=Nocardioides sp. B-3 TaxID=2895565 RepID=UPI002152E3C0|nr:hypothetical protein [Nocardioides sp. B-3]UUZ60901.1 hypothetical protein LP418_09385 [Nocardioides sp. B-3]